MNKKFSELSSGSKGAGDNIEQINSEIECLEVTLSPHEYKKGVVQVDHEGVAYNDYTLIMTIAPTALEEQKTCIYVESEEKYIPIPFLPRLTIKATIETSPPNQVTYPSSEPPPIEIEGFFVKNGI